ncbi:MAG: ferredoxin-type protein NapG [Myxococcales bacterium]|nr:ferredoxin-type protein NapG [Myxococcales bacterium]
MGRGAAGAAVCASAWSAWIRKGQAAAVNVLRPPGALPEARFQAACIKCGQCVTACPYDILRLADLGEDVPVGTPTFDPRQGPCALCPDLPCVKACPTGALDPTLTVAEEARMGRAVLDPHSCLAFNGLRCEACYRACPLIDEAIRLAYRHQARTGVHAFFEPVVNPDACTGCGQCERACPTDVASIQVFPTALVAGRLGAHYRLGWTHDAPVTEAFEQGPQPAPAAPAGEAAPGVDYLNGGIP